MKNDENKIKMMENNEKKEFKQKFYFSSVKLNSKVPTPF